MCGWVIVNITRVRRKEACLSEKSLVEIVAQSTSYQVPTALFDTSQAGQIPSKKSKKENLEALQEGMGTGETE